VFFMRKKGEKKTKKAHFLPPTTPQAYDTRALGAAAAGLPSSPGADAGGDAVPAGLAEIDPLPEDLPAGMVPAQNG
jgi:hypothetical protein